MPGPGDKVIRVDFGKRRREPEQPADESVQPDEPAGDVHELHSPATLPASAERPRRSGVIPPEERFNFDKLIATLEGLAALRRASGIGRRPDSVMLRHRTASMDTWSEGELWRAINVGTESDWAKNPSYYDAVIEELKRRGLLPTR